MHDAAKSIQRLREINESINRGENAGNAEELMAYLCTGEVEGETNAPLLAFRRASGKCEGAKAFLSHLQAEGDRQIQILEEDIQLLGKHVAVLVCNVTTGGQTYRNVRLFVRAKHESLDWKLLGWANEPA